MNPHERSDYFTPSAHGRRALLDVERRLYDEAYSLRRLADSTKDERLKRKATDLAIGLDVAIDIVKDKRKGLV